MCLMANADPCPRPDKCPRLRSMAANACHGSSSIRKIRSAFFISGRSVAFFKTRSSLRPGIISPCADLMSTHKRRTPTGPRTRPAACKRTDRSSTVRLFFALPAARPGRGTSNVAATATDATFLLFVVAGGVKKPAPSHVESACLPGVGYNHAANSRQMYKGVSCAILANCRFEACCTC